jgi:hypothetical protein
MHRVKSFQITEKASFTSQRGKITDVRTSFLVRRGNCFELYYEYKSTWKKYAFIDMDVPSIDSYKHERCKKGNCRKKRSWPVLYQPLSQFIRRETNHKELSQDIFPRIEPGTT